MAEQTVACGVVCEFVSMVGGGQSVSGGMGWCVSDSDGVAVKE